MSRTYRRQNYKPYWVGTTWVQIEGGRHLYRVPMEGDELKRELAKWHGDHCYRMGPTKWWRQELHKEFRAKARQEIVRFYKDEEYEVIIRPDNCWPYWD